MGSRGYVKRTSHSDGVTESKGVVPSAMAGGGGRNDQVVNWIEGTIEVRARRNPAAADRETGFVQEADQHFRVVRIVFQDQDIEWRRHEQASAAAGVSIVQ